MTFSKTKTPRRIARYSSDGAAIEETCPLMKMWPIDSKVGSPRNNTPDIIDEIGRGPTDLFDV
ncbi:hypothetical protein [Mesorhizobium sp. B2-5-7]|uniref:hypothetical protein n=1 Tax=Mesorhizobium sp. B2-5-7 TaxID=2589923 RepID=UPI001FED5D8C|nr:hypothetical protein [Mesorhizobium sp. B2-5-7]